jgi:hypothetical protein
MESYFLSDNIFTAQRFAPVDSGACLNRLDNQVWTLRGSRKKTEAGKMLDAKRAALPLRALLGLQFNIHAD